MKYYIGADLGTSSLKLMLVDENGSIFNTVTEEYPVSYPKSGWSEQNPEDWWNAFVVGVKKLAQNVEKKDVIGIGVAGQMHGLVILDEFDNVIRPTILWNDGRTSAQTDYLNNTIGKRNLSEMTANIAFAGFTAPKILWVKENEPQNFGRISKIMLPKDYINYKLTGAFVTDCSDASGMLLLDVKNRTWSEEMLNICSITKEQMPKLCESYDVVGTLLPQISKELELPDTIKVVAGAGDNAGAAVGTGTIGEGKCNISLGTSGTVFVSSDKFSVDKFNALHSFCHSDGGYHLMGCILSAASCNKWLLEEILKTNDYKGEENNISPDKLGNNNVYFLPYLMGERSPINDTDASGMFIGLRPDVTRSDMFLAVMEGVSFAIRDNIEVAKQLGIQIKDSCLCGGGGKSELWQKILANVLDIELNIPVCEEGPSYGGAMLAMVGCGRFASVAECVKAFVQTKKKIKPDKELVEKYNAKYEKYRKIYPAIKQLYKELKED